MKTEALKLSEKAVEAVQALRIQIELNGGKRLRCRDTQELVQLLEIAQSSNSANVATAFNKFKSELSERQRVFFKSVGLSFDQKKVEVTKSKTSYRGVASDVSKIGGTATSEPAERGKRKIIYRGQVKWV